LASTFKLFPSRITRVRGNPTSDIKRSLLEFDEKKTKFPVEELVIEIERHQYTPEYIDLTKEFYLKM